jgi:hypothetical protein
MTDDFFIYPQILALTKLTFFTFLTSSLTIAIIIFGVRVKVRKSYLI